MKIMSSAPIRFLLNADSLLGRMLCALLYVLTYDFVYHNYIFAYFYYFGLEYVEMSTIKYISWLLFSIIPMTLYQGMKDLAAFLTIFTYLFIYIPFIHALFVLWSVDLQMIYSYSITLCFFFCMFSIVSIRGSFFKNIEFRPSISLRTIEWTSLLITILFIAFKAKYMHFVNIVTQADLLYELRSQNSEATQEIGFVAYLQGWLFGAFYPFLLVNYLKQKNRIKTAIIIGGYFSLFMADMQKLTFLMPFVLIALYFFFQQQYDIIVKRTHSFLILTIIVVTFIFYDLKENEALFMIGSIILLRTVCVSGWLTQIYLQFFNDKPYTHYAHINIVNAITKEYPFDVPLGKAVAYNTQNANANFILTDGVAAWGLVGVIAICLFFLIMLHFIKSVTYRYKCSDLYIICTPSLSYMLNSSIFTTLLSCGFALLLMILASANSPISKTEQHVQTNDTVPI